MNALGGLYEWVLVLLVAADTALCSVCAAVRSNPPQAPYVSIIQHT
jgi:hypothetical protein